MNQLFEKSMSNNLSFWQHKYGEYTPCAPIGEGAHDVDLLIIGGGFTGLTVARETLNDNPHLKVMVLEAQDIGFGASGRNGGFSMAQFGLEPDISILRWGEEKAKQGQAYALKGVEYVRNLIEQENLDSDYEHTGMLRIAYSNSQVKRLRKTFELITSLAPTANYQFLECSAAQAMLNSTQVKAAIFEPSVGILDPCKHVRELKRLAQNVGATLHENTKVLDINTTEHDIKVTTKNASINTKKLVIATNAWTHKIPGLKKLRNRQHPAWSHQIVTEPLTKQELKCLGNQERFSVLDNRHMFHYMRVTQCGRITIGGGDAKGQYGDAMSLWHEEKVWKKLERHFRWLFPDLHHIKIEFKWGGPISVNLDMAPEIGFINDERIIYATGCLGHGVSSTQLNGRLIADLIAGNNSELSKFWIVNRKAIPIPPGSLLKYMGIKIITSVLKGIDKFEERHLVKP